jgi:2-polyprenyl-6-methoxyphenol hydroxylase-like FAD-dependent oxidoreductase
VIDSSSLKVTVAGGSVGGLCAGLALRGIGADVNVFEREPGPMDTRGAGIVVQPHLTLLLREHHAPERPVTSCRVRRYLDPARGAGQTQSAPQEFTSWEAIYLTLRAAFPADRYHMGAAVTDLTPEAARVVTTIDGHGQVESNVLIAADGENSPLRRRFLPTVSPRYAGYVAWRGTIDEANASPPWCRSSMMLSLSAKRDLAGICSSTSFLATALTRRLADAASIGFGTSGPGRRSLPAY